MRPYFLFFMMLALLCNGCQQREESPFQKSSQGQRYNLTIHAKGQSSKASLSGCNDQRISNLQVLVFRPNGALDAYEQGAGNQLSIQCTPGERLIYVFANSTSLEAIQSQEELENFALRLDDSAPNALTMWGKEQIYMGENSRLEIELERLVCKIVLKKVVCNLPEAYKNAKLRFDRIYLTNVPYLYNIKGEIISWANPNEYKAEGGTLLGDNLEPDSYTLSAQDSRILDFAYYCFPNACLQDSHSEQWCERYTRLVIEGTLLNDGGGANGTANGKDGGGANGIKCYYPIPIGQLKANHCYVVEQYTLTRIGLEQLWEDPSLLQPDLDISVLDWYETHRITESL